MLLSRLLPGVALVAGLALAAAPAQAVNMITMQTSATTVNLGDTFTVQIGFDFDDPTFGGGIDLSFDTDAFEIVSFEFDDEIDTDPAFSVRPGEVAAAPRLLAFGNFNPIDGTRKVGNLVLRALLPAVQKLISGEVNDRPAGPFIGEEGGPLEVAILGTEVTVIPEPGTLVLLGAGLAGLGIVRRRS